MRSEAAPAQVKAPLVAVVILNWNGIEDTIRCLESVLDSSHPRLLPIVVDNGSTDGSADRLTGLEIPFVLLTNRVNLGYAEGNNVGIRRAISAGADYVLLLNNDTRIDRSAIAALVETAEADPRIGVLGPRIYFWDSPELIWFDGGEVDPSTVEPRHHGLRETDSARPTGTRDVGYVSGCALMARVEMLKKVGLLDRDYFLVFEETDLCARAEDAGYRAVVVPAAKVWHRVSVSFGGEDSPTYLYYFHRNNLLFVHKRLRGARRLRAYLSVLKRQAHYVWHLHRRRPAVAAERRALIARAVRDFALHRWGMAR